VPAEASPVVMLKVAPNDPDVTPCQGGAVVAVPVSNEPFVNRLPAACADGADSIATVTATAAKIPRCLRVISLPFPRQRRYPGCHGVWWTRCLPPLPSQE
jgi:hypothetical protein